MDNGSQDLFPVQSGIEVAGKIKTSVFSSETKEDIIFHSLWLGGG
jgi:hypothetical protein